MMVHKICCYAEIWVIIPKLSLLPLHICIHVMAQIFKSGDLSNLIRSFDSISGGFLSNYFNARLNIFEGQITVSLPSLPYLP